MAIEPEESEEPEPPHSPGGDEEDNERQAGVEEIQERIKTEQIRREDTAGGALSQGRRDIQRRDFIGLPLLLLMLIGVHVAIIKKQEEVTIVTEQFKSWKRRNVEIWRGRTSRIQRQGGHKGSTGQVKCGEG